MTQEDSSYDRPWKAQLAPLLSEVTGLEVIPYGYCDFGRKAQPEAISVIIEPDHQPGKFSFGVISSELKGKAGEYLKAIRSRLPAGFVAYIGTTHWLNPLGDSNKKERPDFSKIKPLTSDDFVAVLTGDRNPFKERIPLLLEQMQKMQARSGIELAIGIGESQFDIVRLAKTDAINHGLSTEEIVERLIAINRELEIDINAACSDAIDFELGHAPDDPLKFSKELFAFCPDLKSSYTIPEYAEKLRKGAVVTLWWD